MPYAALVQAGGWPNGQNLSSANFEALVKRIGNGIDGDNGGSYAPVQALRISGSGLTILAPPKRIEPYLRTVRVSALERAVDVVNAGSSGFIITEAPTVGSRIVRGVAMDFNIPFAFPLSRVSDGSTLFSASAEFYVPSSRNALPTVPLTIDVRRMDPTTGIGESLATGAQSFATPTTLTAYVNGGLPNVATFIPDPAKSLIDLTKYTYFAIITNDSGLGGISPNILSAFETSMIVSTMGFE